MGTVLFYSGLHSFSKHACAPDGLHYKDNYVHITQKYVSTSFLAGSRWEQISFYLCPQRKHCLNSGIYLVHNRIAGNNPIS